MPTSGKLKSEECLPDTTPLTTLPLTPTKKSITPSPTNLPLPNMNIALPVLLPIKASHTFFAKINYGL